MAFPWVLLDAVGHPMGAVGVTWGTHGCCGVMAGPTGPLQVTRDAHGCRARAALGRAAGAMGHPMDAVG